MNSNALNQDPAVFFPNNEEIPFLMLLVFMVNPFLWTQLN